MIRPILALAALGIMGFALPAWGAASRPVVVELFTSQGCASCPAADAILKKIAANPGFLPLSFHVTYFDKQGWRDPYATVANSNRQKQYVRTLGVESVYTPQIVVDGAISAVGSNPNQVAEALEAARGDKIAIPMSINLNSDGAGLDVVVGGSVPVPVGAVLYEVHFNRSSVTPVSAGENNGMTLENVNNVIAFFPIAITPQYYVPLSGFAEDGIAYILQNDRGRVIGAAYYLKNQNVNS